MNISHQERRNHIFDTDFLSNWQASRISRDEQKKERSKIPLSKLLDMAAKPQYMSIYFHTDS
jgi:hypothetical protein